MDVSQKRKISLPHRDSNPRPPSPYHGRTPTTPPWLPYRVVNSSKFKHILPGSVIDNFAFLCHGINLKRHVRIYGPPALAMRARISIDAGTFIRSLLCRPILVLWRLDSPTSAWLYKDLQTPTKRGAQVSKRGVWPRRGEGRKGDQVRTKAARLLTTRI